MPNDFIGPLEYGGGTYTPRPFDIYDPDPAPTYWEVPGFVGPPGGVPTGRPGEYVSLNPPQTSDYVIPGKHQMGDGSWMTGRTHTPRSQYLTNQESQTYDGKGGSFTVGGTPPPLVGPRRPDPIPPRTGWSGTPIDGMTIPTEGRWWFVFPGDSYAGLRQDDREGLGRIGAIGFAYGF